MSSFLNIFTELNINYNVADYRKDEGGELENTIRFTFQETQNPFTLILYPVTIDKILEFGKVLSDIVGASAIGNESKAKAGICSIVN